LKVYSDLAKEGMPACRACPQTWWHAVPAALCSRNWGVGGTAQRGGDSCRGLAGRSLAARSRGVALLRGQARQWLGKDADDDAEREALLKRSAGFGSAGRQARQTTRGRRVAADRRSRPAGHDPVACLAGAGWPHWSRAPIPATALVRAGARRARPARHRDRPARRTGPCRFMEPPCRPGAGSAASRLGDGPAVDRRRHQRRISKPTFATSPSAAG